MDERETDGRATDDRVSHRVMRLWIRPEEGGAMREVQALSLLEGKGVSGDHTLGRMRHVTLLFERDWQAAAAEVGARVDPEGRRANVLLSGGGALVLIGARVRLGTAEIQVMGETRPCPVMDRAHPGMMTALKPEGRAGVWGRVVRSGEVRLGDALRTLV